MSATWPGVGAIGHPLAWDRTHGRDFGTQALPDAALRPPVVAVADRPGRAVGRERILPAASSGRNIIGSCRGGLARLSGFDEAAEIAARHLLVKKQLRNMRINPFEHASA
ncbi:hypothetical protein [Methylorubrum populi]|uniref:hypothetical protein n=1 Tax=Methylorubrum populi TaxID=223967 RepID=UPI001264EA15